MRFAAALAGHGLPWPAFCIGFSFWEVLPASPAPPTFLLPASPTPHWLASAPLGSPSDQLSPGAFFGPAGPSLPFRLASDCLLVLSLRPPSSSPRSLPAVSILTASPGSLSFARGFLLCLPAFRFHSRSPFRLYPLSSHLLFSVPAPAPCWPLAILFSRFRLHSIFPLFSPFMSPSSSRGRLSHP